MPDSTEARAARKQKMLAAKEIAAAATTDEPGKETTAKKPPKKRKVATDAENSKTKQIRYDPEQPMGKEELAAWRREARRVRNRESAAASRQRIRNRISELEEEVGQWKSKYTEAVQRLEALEAAMATRPEALAAAAAAQGGK